MTSPFGCFACNGADHWESSCPELQPPKSKAEYESRLAKYVRWFRDDEPPRITAQQKQRLIASLNESWRKERKAG